MTEGVFAIKISGGWSVLTYRDGVILYFYIMSMCDVGCEGVCEEMT